MLLTLVCRDSNIVLQRSLTRGPVRHRVVLLVPTVEGGAPLQQQADKGRVAGDDGHVQGGEALVVRLGQQGRIGSQQQVGAVRAGVLHAVVQSRPAVSVLDACARLIGNEQRRGRWSV